MKRIVLIGLAAMAVACSPVETEEINVESLVMETDAKIEVDAQPVESAYTGAYRGEDAVDIIAQLPEKRRLCDINPSEDNDECRFLANAEMALADRCVNGDKLACEHADPKMVEASRAQL